MSDKLKPNFTPVPNVLLDEIMRGLNEGEFKTVMAICRYTYGWGKQSDQISLNQLADITGMNRSNVARARKRLGNLVEVTPGTATMASTYRLNIEISDAELKATSVKGSDRSATSDPSATSVKGSDPSATFRRKPKKEKPSDSVFPIIEKIIHTVNELSGRAYHADSKAVCRYLRARLKAGATEADCLAVLENRWGVWGNNDKMREHFNPVTLFREENFVRYLAEARATGNGNGAAITEEQRQRQRRETFVNA
jgi:phage replication O-like protein O